MSSVCPNGTLILGYIPDFFPYIWTDENGRTRGVFEDLWTTMTPRLGCARHEYRRYDRASQFMSAICVVSAYTDSNKKGASSSLGTTSFVFSPVFGY